MPYMPYSSTADRDARPRPGRESFRAYAENPAPSFAPISRRLGRQILVSFPFTFIIARVLVFLIVARRIPDVYLHLGGTHIHHLNYGIFLLSAVGAYLLLGRPDSRTLRRLAIFYGVGLALTFDEFGLWLHLGGSYWQRASFDAVVVIAALLGLVVVAPALHHFRPHHWATAVALVVAVAIFGVCSSIRSSTRIGSSSGCKSSNNPDRCCPESRYLRSSVASGGGALGDTHAVP